MTAREHRVDEPTDPDTDLTLPAQRWESARGQAPVIAVIAAGGAVGTTARYGAGLIWPTASGGFPWTTLVINAAGCAIIGVFMVLISEVWATHRLLRFFIGTGVLGGFTTFSTYAIEATRLLQGGRARTGLVYLVLTVLVALGAVWAAAVTTRRLITRRGLRRGVGRAQPRGDEG
ncbi:CrcB family protein [Actinoallomurus sp. NPDC052274]|uniref:fluoride efflux transporter FluC n=1 Tax=Actinoallomurus sp. NPDC052274 TaxID=3155420 RepID=UPI00343333D8